MFLSNIACLHACGAIVSSALKSLALTVMPGDVLLLC